MVSPEKLIVHIKTFDDAVEVVGWFESFGYRRDALTPDVYLDYPYIHISRQGILTGTRYTGARYAEYTVMEYEEWWRCIVSELDSENPVDEEEFIRLVTGT